jgi:hypothetical protein
MLCLVSWMIRAVDEVSTTLKRTQSRLIAWKRPRAIDVSASQRHTPHSPPPPHAPPYTSPHSHSRAASYQDLTGFEGYDTSHTPHNSHGLPFQHAVADFAPHQGEYGYPGYPHHGGLPGYYDTPMGAGAPGGAGFGPQGMGMGLGYHAWSGGRGFSSPPPVPGFAGGGSWYARVHPWAGMR